MFEINSKSSTTLLSFQIYDPVSDAVYDVDYSYTFSVNDIVGGAANPIVMSGTQTMRRGGSFAAMGKYYDPYDEFSAYGPQKFAGGGRSG